MSRLTVVTLMRSWAHGHRVSERPLARRPGPTRVRVNVDTDRLPAPVRLVAPRERAASGRREVRYGDTQVSSFKKATVLAAGTAALVMAGAGAASAAADADGAAVGSPGVASGLNVQIPVH
ncbi:chaplin family protein, partial [Embleya sp. NPDC059267]|uniref:chaplin family protein n=1 Tax=Embleya sp. NPDC059267 TaxID=3346798 RepID=UPI0036B05470